MRWFVVSLAVYLLVGVAVWRLVARSSRPRGAPWAIVLWPLWLFPRSS